MRIVKGMPLVGQRRRGREPKYPWREMEVGDVLVVDDGDFGGIPLGNIRIAAYSWAKANGARMSGQIKDGKLYVQRIG